MQSVLDKIIIIPTCCSLKDYWLNRGEVWRGSVKCFIVFLLFCFDLAKLTYIKLSNSVNESVLDFAMTALFEDHWVLSATYSMENKLEEFYCCVVIDT